MPLEHAENEVNNYGATTFLLIWSMFHASSYHRHPIQDCTSDFLHNEDNTYLAKVS